MSKYMEEEQFNQYFKQEIDKTDIVDLITNLHLLIKNLK